jgi:hypothetical protein
MKFRYSSVISVVPDTGDYLLLRRPEIPITIVGPSGSASYIGLVDTGSDNTIFPQSVAHHLGIQLESALESTASTFGGHQVNLLTGNAVLRLEADGESLAWKTPLCFYDFESADKETVILGHSAFLDYFTATFDGKEGVLTLISNDELPLAR